jgi:hypothetical protein
LGTDSGALDTQAGGDPGGESDGLARRVRLDLDPSGDGRSSLDGHDLALSRVDADRSSGGSVGGRHSHGANTGTGVGHLGQTTDRLSYDSEEAGAGDGGLGLAGDA